MFPPNRRAEKHRNQHPIDAVLSYNIINVMSGNVLIILCVLFGVVYGEMEPEIDGRVTVFLRPLVGGKHTPLIPSSSSDAYTHNIIAIPINRRLG